MSVESPISIPDDDGPEVLPLEWLRDSGLLWLINRVVFHPRGWALAAHADGQGRIDGWALLGDGREVWTMPSSIEDELFAKAQALLDPA